MERFSSSSNLSPASAGTAPGATPGSSAAFPPDLLWQAVAEMGQALGTASRLHLLAILASGPRTVGELAEITGQAVPAASAQLQVLKRAGLLAGDRHGRQVRYRHASPQVTRLVAMLRETAESRLPSVREVVEDVLRDPGTLSSLGIDELESALAAGLVVLLDVRSEGEFVAGHLPGAINLPSHAMAERLEELRERLGPGQAVVACCRGPYCVTAVNAVDLLRRHGFEAARLSFGLDAWRAASRPVVRPDVGTEHSREISA